MVPPSLQHVAPCVKRVQWGLSRRGLRMVAELWAGIPVEDFQFPQGTNTTAGRLSIHSYSSSEEENMFEIACSRPGRKNNSDQTYTCPRDWRHLVGIMGPN